MTAPESTRPRTRSLELTGIASEERRKARRDGALRVAAVASIAGATLALSGCTPPKEGVVLDGADGKQYVMPEGALRPEYDSKEDCIADVTEQIEKLKSQGESIGETPEELCEESSHYRGHYGHAWLGPILFPGTRWGSSRVSSWTPVTGGAFAAPGSHLQPDVYSPAPAGAATGSRAPLTGGFGSTGKSGSGFGESVGS